MTDVFISYAKEDRDLAAALAARLAEKGIASWWDHRLTAADDYVRQINAAIDRSRAVVVVWSWFAADSEWVTAEAERGRQQQKLVSTFAPGFEPSELRAPFNIRHSVPAGDVSQILAALDRLGVRPGGDSAARQPPSKDPDDETRGGGDEAPGKWFGAQVAAAVVVVLAVVVLLFRWQQQERAAEEQALQVARDTNTIEALETFIGGDYDSDLIATATSQLAGLVEALSKDAMMDFESAGRHGTVEAWDSFIARYASYQRHLGDLLDRANQSRDGAVVARDAFEAARKVDSLESWQAFLQQQTNGDYAGRARAALRKLLAAELTFAKADYVLADAADTIAGWTQFDDRFGFLSKYLGDGWIDQVAGTDSAHSLVEALGDFRTAVASDTLRGWDAFLSKHGDSPYAAAVGAERQRRYDQTLAELDTAYRESKAEDRVERWQDFLDRYGAVEPLMPERAGSFAAARARIEALVAEGPVDCIRPDRAVADRSTVLGAAPTVTGRAAFAIDGNPATSWTLSSDGREFWHIRIQFDRPLARAVGVRVAPEVHVHTALNAAFRIESSMPRYSLSGDRIRSGERWHSWATISEIELFGDEEGWAEISEFCVLQLQR